MDADGPEQRCPVCRLGALDAGFVTSPYPVSWWPAGTPWWRRVLMLGAKPLLRRRWLGTPRSDARRCRHCGAVVVAPPG